MARGLVAGGVFLSFCALACALLARLGDAPARAWLVQRTEVYDRVCVRAAGGLYTVGDAWGDDLDQLARPRRGRCRPDEDGQLFERPIKAMERYCRADDPDSSFNSAMCVRTIVGQACAFFALLLHLGAISAGLFCHAVDTVRDEVLPASIAASLALLASLCSWGTFIAMATSPLFSAAHYAALGQQAKLLIPYRGIGCVFQEPFASPWWPMKMFYNWPEECLLFGYGYVLAVSEACMSLLASLIFAVLALDLRRLWAHQKQVQRNADMDLDTIGEVRANTVGTVAGDDAAQVPRAGAAEGSSSAANLGVVTSADSVPRADANGDIGAGVDPLTRADAPLLASVDGDFSLDDHGANGQATTNSAGLGRATATHPAVGDGIAGRVRGGVEREAIGPSSASVPTGKNSRFYSLYGAFHRHLGKSRGWFMRRLIATFVPLALTAVLGLTVKCIIAGVRFSVNIRVQAAPILDEDVCYEVFDYNSVTSVTDFWLGGAHLMSTLTFLATFFVPISKFAIWLFLWYIPCDELRRGWILTWVDALGKVALANTFSLVLMSVGFLFDSHLEILKGMALVDVTVGINPGFIGTWGPVLASFLSLLAGQWLVYFHGRAARWEQIRRAGRSAVLASRQSVFRVMDTPFRFDERDAADENADAARSANRNRQPYQVASPLSLNHGVDLLSESDDLAPLLPRSFEPHEVRAPLCYAALGRARVFAPLARRAVDFVLFAAVSLTIAGLFTPCLTFTRKGVTTALVVDKADHTVSSSVFDLIGQVHSITARRNEGNLLALSGSIAAFAFVFPLLHLLALLVAWRAPGFSLTRHEKLFRFVELCAAWNALDVFLVCILVTRADIDIVADTLIPQVVPNLSNAVHPLRLYSAIEELADGFWVLVAACALEKLLTWLIVPLHAAHIARRRLAQMHRMGLGDPEDSLEARDLLEVLSPSARYATAHSSRIGAKGGILEAVLHRLNILIDDDRLHWPA